MNADLLEHKQEQVLKAAVDRYAISGKAVDEVKTFALRQGHFVTAYLQDQRAFVLSDGEPYTLEAVRKSYVAD